MLLCPQIIFLMVGKQLPAARKICFLFMSRERRVTTYHSLCNVRTIIQKGPGTLSLVLVAELSKMLDPEHWGLSHELRSLAKCIVLQVGRVGTAASMHYEFVVQSSMRVNRISILDQLGPEVTKAVLSNQCYSEKWTEDGPERPPTFNKQRERSLWVRISNFGLSSVAALM